MMKKEEAIARILAETARLYAALDSGEEDFSDLGIDMDEIEEENRSLLEAYETVLPILQPGLTGREEIEAEIKRLGITVPGSTLSDLEEKIGSELLRAGLSSRDPEKYRHVFGSIGNNTLAHLLCTLVGPDTEFSIDDDFEVYLHPVSSRVLVLVNGETEIPLTDFPEVWQEKLRELICGTDSMS